MSILTNRGKLVLAEVFKTGKTYHCAWGRGSSDWDTSSTPSPTTEDTALVSEVGRRQASLVEYCTPDTSGTISVPSGTYTASSSRTLYVHLRFEFSLDDSPAETIREVGVFCNTSVKSGATGYLTPDKITDIGDMILVQRFSSISLQDTPKRAFDFVITI